MPLKDFKVTLTDILQPHLAAELMSLHQLVSLLSDEPPLWSTLTHLPTITGCVAMQIGTDINLIQMMNPTDLWFSDFV